MTNWHYQARQIIKRAEASARQRFKVWSDYGVTQEWRDYNAFFIDELEKVIADDLKLVSEASNGNG